MPSDNNHSWITTDQHLCLITESQCTNIPIYIWVRSRNCGCLVTWFCYQLIANQVTRQPHIHDPTHQLLRKPAHFLMTLVWSSLSLYSWFPWWSIHQVSKSLTQWGRVTHICVGKLIIIGSDNGLSPGRRRPIIWTNAGIWLIGPLPTNFSDTLITIETFSLRKMHLKMSSGKCRPFCLSLKVDPH